MLRSCLPQLPMMLTPILMSRLVQWTPTTGCMKHWQAYIPFLRTGESSIERTSNFLTDGCGCKNARGKSCSGQFSTEYIVSVRESCLEPSHSELDMAIMGQLMAGMNTSSTVSTASRHKEVNRDKNYTTLFHLGKPVCLKTFQFLHAVGKKRLRNLMANVRSNGLTPRVHNNTRRRPRHALSFNSTSFLTILHVSTASPFPQGFPLSYTQQHVLHPNLSFSLLLYLPLRLLASLQGSLYNQIYLLYYVQYSFTSLLLILYRSHLLDCFSYYASIYSFPPKRIN